MFFSATDIDSAKQTTPSEARKVCTAPVRMKMSPLSKGPSRLAANQVHTMTVTANSVAVQRGGVRSAT